MDAVELQSRDPCSYMLRDEIKLLSILHYQKSKKFRYTEYTVASWLAGLWYVGPCKIFSVNHCQL